MTIQEIMARLEGSQRISSAGTRSLLGKTAATERSDIREARRTYEEDVLESEGQAQAQAEEDSVVDLVGTLIGAFNPLAGAGFTGVVKSARQKDIKAPTLKLKPGMFYKQTRKDLESDVKSTRDFIGRANDSFVMNTIADAARVGFTSAKFQKAFPGFKDAGGSLLTGDASLSDLFSYDPATTGQLPGASIPGLEQATGGGLLDTGLFDPATGRSAFGRLDSSFLPSFNLEDQLGYTSPFGINNLPS
jgi:hypothetical protein|tara:strand:- start:284 stop:1024 length:741 start_codon:yes stop_codon:yes gene_type:complete